jgi:hypothetical protein
MHNPIIMIICYNLPLYRANKIGRDELNGEQLQAYSDYVNLENKIINLIKNSPENRIRLHQGTWHKCGGVEN